MVWRERQFDPGSCDWTGGNDPSRAFEHDRQCQRIWTTPGVERMAIQHELMNGRRESQPHAEQVAGLVVLDFRIALKPRLHPLTRTVQGRRKRIEGNRCVALGKQATEVVEHFPLKRVFWLGKGLFHTIENEC